MNFTRNLSLDLISHINTLSMSKPMVIDMGGKLSEASVAEQLKYLKLREYNMQHSRGLHGWATHIAYMERMFQLAAWCYKDFGVFDRLKVKTLVIQLPSSPGTNELSECVNVRDQVQSLITKLIEAKGHWLLESHKSKDGSVEVAGYQLLLASIMNKSTYDHSAPYFKDFICLTPSFELLGNLVKEVEQKLKNTLALWREGNFDAMFETTSNEQVSIPVMSSPTSWLFAYGEVFSEPTGKIVESEVQVLQDEILLKVNIDGEDVYFKPVNAKRLSDAVVEALMAPMGKSESVEDNLAD